MREIMCILSIKHYLDLPGMRRSGSVGGGLRICSPTGSEGKHIKAENTSLTMKFILLKQYIYCQSEHIASWPTDDFVHDARGNDICACPNNVLADEFLHESGRYASVACHHRSFKTTTYCPTYLVENWGGVRVRGCCRRTSSTFSVTPRFKRVKLSRKWSWSICALLPHWMSSSMDTLVYVSIQTSRPRGIHVHSTSRATLS